MQPTSDSFIPLPKKIENLETLLEGVRKAYTRPIPQENSMKYFEMLRPSFWDPSKQPPNFAQSSINRS